MDEEEVELTGISNGTFYYVHIPPLVCIFVSLIGVVYVIVSSITSHRDKPFFSWGRSERFVVYLAVCDGLFNISHCLDHAQMAITKDNVQPPILCAVYAFLLVEFVNAQNILILVISINAFVMTKFRHTIDFGKNDWRLMIFTFGVPCIEASIAFGLDQLGPTGTFCGIRGGMAFVVLSTIPMIMILTVISVLYFMTWYHIRREAKQICRAIGEQAQSTRAYHNAAKVMTLFVIAFVAQWWPLAVYGLVQLLSSDTSQFIIEMVVTVCNLGGLFNCLVFVIMLNMKSKVQKRIDDRKNYLKRITMAPKNFAYITNATSSTSV